MSYKHDGFWQCMDTKIQRFFRRVLEPIVQLGCLMNVNTAIKVFDE